MNTNETNIETLLRAYTKWLLDHGYCDDDVWCDEPDAVRAFLDENKITRPIYLCSPQMPKPNSLKRVRE